MFLLYNILLTLLAPLWVPWMLIRSRKRNEQPNWKERCGDYSKSIPKKGDRPRIWVHAVSVGEVVAVTPILRELRRVLPDHEILLSVTTSSGHATAREQEDGLFDYLVYFPIDVARFQLSALQSVRPDAVVVMETELWMNFLWAAKVFDARTILVNGRISDRAFPRSQKIKFFYRSLLANVDRCLMQSDVDRDRILQLGAKSADVLGNCKFDQAVEGLQSDPALWRKELGLSSKKPVVVVGSTRGDMEPKLVVQALSLVGLEKIDVVHAPRHLETAPALADLVRETFGQVALRSKGETGPYLVLDSYGELAQVYSVADVVIVGGGFDNLGGQNILQPLAHGKPVIHGPHMQNFREVTQLAQRAGADIEASTAEEIAAAVNKLLDDKPTRDRMGKAARKAISENLGASRRLADVVAQEVKKNHK